MNNLIKLLAQLDDQEIKRTEKFIELLLYIKENPDSIDDIEKMPYSANEVKNECSSRLRGLRASLGLSMNKMAEAMYVDRRTWQRYEDGESCPTVSEYQRFFYMARKEILI